MTINIVHQPHTCMFCIKSTCIEPVLKILDSHRHFNCRKTSYMYTSFALIFFTYFPESIWQNFLFIQTNSSIIFNCLNPVLLVPGFRQVSQHGNCVHTEVHVLNGSLNLQIATDNFYKYRKTRYIYRSTCIKGVLKFVDSHRHFL